VILADTERKSEDEGNVKVVSSEDGNDDEDVIRERVKEEKLREIIYMFNYQVL